MKDQKHWFLTFYAFCLSAVLVMTACGAAPRAEETGSESEVAPTAAASEPEATTPANNAPSTDSGYVGPGVVAQPDYPMPTMEGLSPELPNPDVQLPATDSETAVVGGVLVREITDQGFIPVTPNKLLLGEIVNTDSGEPAFLRARESGRSAELLPTGVFIFRGIPPGTYGLVADIGLTQLPVTSAEERGEIFLFTVEAGQALELGQVFVEFPGDSSGQ